VGKTTTAISIGLISLLLLGWGYHFYSQSAFDEAEADQLFEAFNADNSFMGSVALSHDGELFYKNQAGFAEISSATKVTDNTKHRIGSITKTYTAALVFKAIEAGKLGLDQTIEAFFPALPNADKITVDHLLSHRSGIRNYIRDEYFRENRVKYMSPADILIRITQPESDFEPGTDADYSNSNYVLLTFILEGIYGLSYADLVVQEITVPLQLSSTYYDDKIDPAQQESRSYQFKDGWVLDVETDVSNALGAGGIVSTPHEVNVFLHALFNQQLISNDNLQKMTEIRDGFGRGLIRYSLSNRTSYGHSGRMDGHRSLALYFPDRKVGITLLGNGVGDNKNDIVIEMLDNYFSDEELVANIEDLTAYQGRYVEEGDPTGVLIFTRDGTVLNMGALMPNGEPGPGMPLVFHGDKLFASDQLYAESIYLTFDAEGKKVMVRQSEVETAFFKVAEE